MKKTTLARLINLFNGKREWNVTKSGNGKRVATRVYGKRAFSSNAFFLPVFLPQFYFFLRFFTFPIFRFSGFSRFSGFAFQFFAFLVFRFSGFFGLPAFSKFFRGFSTSCYSNLYWNAERFARSVYYKLSY